MPKLIEEPRLSGDRFVIVGFADDLYGQNDDFYQICYTPIIQSFKDDNLWWVPAERWSASDARRVSSRDKAYFSYLNSSEYIIIHENQYLNMVGDTWLGLLRTIDNGLAAQFDGWKREEGDGYSFSYTIGTNQEHIEFNTSLAEALETLMVAAVKSGDVKTLDIAHHLYEGASAVSNIPRKHSIVVTGVYCSLVDAERGLPLIEQEAKLEKLYKNHRKWNAALAEYRTKNGIS